MGTESAFPEVKNATKYAGIARAAVAAASRRVMIRVITLH
jgi:hypothetical protein